MNFKIREILIEAIECAALVVAIWLWYWVLP
jgi:hypothetical protein